MKTPAINRAAAALALGLAVALLNASVDAAAFHERQTLTLANSGPWDNLGYSAAADDAVVLAGAINIRHNDADVGAAFIYRPDEDGSWQQAATLMADDSGHNDAFGYAVGVEGNRAIVGAALAKVPGGFDGTRFTPTRFTGAAYVFGDTGNDNWRQLSKLVPDHPQQFEYLGSAVDISNDSAVVAARNVGTGSGRDPPPPGGALVFREQSAGDWRQAALIQADDRSSNDGFGFDVAIEGEVIIAGANNADPNGLTDAGAAYVYYAVDQTWTQAARLVPSDPLPGARFGWSVAVDGRRILVGASAHKTQGAAYLFEKAADGAWLEIEKFSPPSGSPDWGFGAEVALHGDLAVITAWQSPMSLAEGVVYIFRRDTLGQWKQAATLVSPSSIVTFGHSLATTGGQIFVGSGVNTPGAVHVFSPVPEPAAAALLALGFAVAAFVRRTQCAVPRNA